MSEDSSGLNSEEEKMSLKRKILFPILKTVRYQINLATNNINNASHLSKGGLLAQTIFNPKLFVLTYLYLEHPLFLHFNSFSFELNFGWL